MYAEKLERSNQELEEFAFIASHDLKEPLRKVKSFGVLLKGRAAAKLDPVELDFLDRMIVSTRRMQEMIEGLLALARISSAGKPFIQVNLNLVLDEVVEELAALIEEREARVEVDTLPVVQADIFQMRQLFRNLVWNALKFVEEGRQPVVRVSEYRGAAKIEGGATSYIPNRDSVQIAVEDNGIGFTASEARKVFLPFQQLNKKSIHEGSGIGLTVCRKIVERHGGSISVTSTPGQGSTFVVRLPAKK
jgi:signal transduction histidine kinase